MKSTLNLSVALLLAASSLAPAVAQTNPDPWANPFVEPYGSNLGLLMQHAGTNIFDPDLKAKIQALGPNVTIVDVPMGHHYFYDGFEQDALVDNYYYLTANNYHRIDPRHAFGTGPLAKWQATNGSQPPVIINIDNDGPLGEPQQLWYNAVCAWHDGMGCNDGLFFWPFMGKDALPSGNTPRNYAINLSYNDNVSAGNRTFESQFTATCTGSGEMSSWWAKYNPARVMEPSTNNTAVQLNDPNWRERIRDFQPDSGVGPQLINLNTGASIVVNWAKRKENDWNVLSAAFATVKGQQYKIRVSLPPNVGVDEIQVHNLTTCYKTVPNLFYKPPNTGPTIGGLDLSNVTMSQVELINPKIQFDPLSTVYFPPTDPQIGPGACCGPFSEKDIANLLTPVFPSGGNSAYTMQYAPNAMLDAQMAAYLNYVHSQNPSITTISMEWSAANLGTGATPVDNGPFVAGAATQTVTWTWTPNGVTSSGGNFWSGAPFNINSWYGFMTRITHNGTPDSPLFGADCVQNWWKFRVQGTNKIFAPGGNRGPLTYQAVGADGRVRALQRKPAPQAIR